MMSSEAELLTVRGLRKSYGDTVAAASIDLNVHAGEVLGLLGPNGAGKTTLVESVLGLIEPESGSVSICGVDALQRHSEAMQHVGATLQGAGLQDNITPREAVLLFGSLSSQRAEVTGLLERFGLSDKADAPFASLSAGQKQRVTLALACVGNPRVLLLDEPTVNLDSALRREVHAFIRRVRDEGKAVLLTTHDMDEAESLCDRIAVLNKGRVVAAGSPRELIAASSRSMRIEFETEPACDPSWFADVVESVAMNGDVASLSTAGDVNIVLADVLTAVTRRDAKVVRLHVYKATLEDVISQLTDAA